MTSKRQSGKGVSSEPDQPLAAEIQPALNKDGSRRKSRVLRRKTDHSIIERRRREKINEKLVSLQNIVPACRKECRDLIERKFVEAANAAPAKAGAKRKREVEKLEKAQSDMQEKIKTSMVLEKLCIISHTLDFVQQLREENEALRALCECQAQTKRRGSISSDVEMDEHYRDAHSLDTDKAAAVQESSHIVKAEEERKRLRASISSPESDVLPDTMCRHARRRLHWGSDRVRESSSLTDEVWRDQEAPETRGNDASSRGCLSSASPCSAEEPGDCTSSASACVLACAEPSCQSYLQTRNSCCREDDALSSSASDEPASPPPTVASWRDSAAACHQTHLGSKRHLLPSITHLGLPKYDPLHSVARNEAAYSLYRRHPARLPEMAPSRPFRPLSLYTSQTVAPLRSSIKP